MSLAKIDEKLGLPQSSAAKSWKRLNENKGVNKLVKRLQDIQFWERGLDRKKHLETQRKKQADAKSRGEWLYGKLPAGRYPEGGKLQLEPVESGIIRTSGLRVIAGERLYSVAKTAGYDHRTLRDIVKNPINKELFTDDQWSKLQSMLKDPPKGPASWGFKWIGHDETVDTTTGAEVRNLAGLRIKRWTVNRIVDQVKWPSTNDRDQAIARTTGRLKRLHSPKYTKILGADWQKFVDVDNEMKRLRRSS